MSNSSGHARQTAREQNESTSVQLVAKQMTMKHACLLTILIAIVDPSWGFSTVYPCCRVSSAHLRRKEQTSPNSRFDARSGLTSLSIANKDDKTEDQDTERDFVLISGLFVVGFLYWYWMVFGAAAAANGLPGVPDFLPMTPGWPPSQEDLQGPLDDAFHFFYLSELLGKTDAPFAPPTRLAVYNVAEAWIFSMLPLLWKDSRRLPRPILLGLWAILGINLTNAFLAPYLFVTAALVEPSRDVRQKNKVVSYAMGGISSAVALYALFQVGTSTTFVDWSEFVTECKQDRTYFAFVVDLVLFSLFQPYLLKRVEGNSRNVDFVPLVGLLSWLFRDDRNAKQS